MDDAIFPMVGDVWATEGGKEVVVDAVGVGPGDLVGHDADAGGDEAWTLGFFLDNYRLVSRAPGVSPGGDAVGEPPCDFADRVRCLEDARAAVCGDRNRQYGEPHEDFRSIAGAWAAYLSDRLRPGASLAPHDVGAMMVMLKACRLRTSPGKEDHWVDIAGYAACGMECVNREGGGGDGDGP